MDKRRKPSGDCDRDECCADPPDLEQDPHHEQQQADGVIQLCSQVFQCDYSYYMNLPLDRVHVLGYIDGLLVSHALWLDRRLRIGSGPWQVSVVVLVSMSIALLLDAGQLLVMQSAVQSIAVTVLAEGATRPFYAPLDLTQVSAALDLAYATAPLDLSQSTAPLDVANVLAPLDMETETA